MTDEEYIRKAVEFIDAGQYPRDHHNQELDVLAAQLVREVDALPDTGPSKDDGEIVVWIEKGATDIIERSTVGVNWCKELLSVRGPNRTMNTIKAIVDSGVLDD